MRYPSQHREIVKELLNGKFIVDDSPLFDVIHQNTTFYHQFFEATYGYYLEDRGAFYYLTSVETTEHSSRDLLLFLSLLCFEYRNRGVEIIHKMSEGTFLVKEVTKYIETSRKRDLLKKTQVTNPKTDKLDVPGFLEKWQKRNLIQYTNKDQSQFQFKKPINLFLDTAFALYEESLSDSEESKPSTSG